MRDHGHVHRRANVRYWASVLSRPYAIVDTAGLDERRARDWVVVRTMVNVAWQLLDGDAGGAPARAPHDWITRNITIAKAMLAVEAP